MASVPIYEGDYDQMHGSHFSREPINRSHNPILPTPEHAIGATPSAIAINGLAAHVAPRPQQEQDVHSGAATMPPGALEVMDVVVQFI